MVAVVVGVVVGVGVAVVVAVVVGVAVAVGVVVAVGVGVVGGVGVGVAVAVGVGVGVVGGVVVGVVVIHSLIGPLPRHLYVYVDTTFTHRGAHPRYQPAVWFGLTSTPGRMWGCTIMFESGAVYRALPPHAIAFSVRPEEQWTAQDAQTWDCYSTDFSAVEYPYLAGLRCLAKAGAQELPGQHLFAVAPIGDGFSAVPAQAKEFHFIQLDDPNGRLCVVPTDRVVYEDRSFTTGPLAFPHGLRAQTDVYRCE